VLLKLPINDKDSCLPNLLRISTHGFNAVFNLLTELSHLLFSSDIHLLGLK
jgi:hypothetical protein